MFCIILLQPQQQVPIAEVSIAEASIAEIQFLDDPFAIAQPQVQSLAIQDGSSAIEAELSANSENQLGLFAAIAPGLGLEFRANEPDIAPVVAENVVDEFSRIAELEAKMTAALAARRIFPGPCLLSAKETAIQFFAGHMNELNIFSEGDPQYALKDLNALVVVTQKFINRHHNPIWDTLTGKNNTHSWTMHLQQARTLGKTAIRQFLAKSEDGLEEKIKLLRHYRELPLFREHRHNYSWQGAFKRTATQAWIDEQIVILTQKLEALSKQNVTGHRM